MSGASPGTNTVTTLPAPAGGCKVATFTVSGTNTLILSFLNLDNFV
jgi:hypothetical protein